MCAVQAQANLLRVDFENVNWICCKASRKIHFVNKCIWILSTYSITSVWMLTVSIYLYFVFCILYGLYYYLCAFSNAFPAFSAEILSVEVFCLRKCSYIVWKYLILLVVSVSVCVRAYVNGVIKTLTLIISRVSFRFLSSVLHLFQALSPFWGL